MSCPLRAVRPGLVTGAKDPAAVRLVGPLARRMLRTRSCARTRGGWWSWGPSSLCSWPGVATAWSRPGAAGAVELEVRAAALAVEGGTLVGPRAVEREATAVGRAASPISVASPAWRASPVREAVVT